MANVMVSADAADGQNVEALSDWLRDEAPRREQPDVLGVGSLRLITGPDGAWGGGKNPECEVWAGALNHADLDELRRRFAGTPWREPNAAQLLIMDQEEVFFRLWMIRGGELRQYAPWEASEQEDAFYGD
ncbi:squamosa promoter-binding protein 15 [Streptomyces sp. NPDC048275]|uniref:squamosa promoter-binding protein 15 n=1 Tax=Streptomyces sp. NPDC048275 TaxID=3155629 RepID=UPI00340F32BC